MNLYDMLKKEFADCDPQSDRAGRITMSKNHNIIWIMEDGSSEIHSPDLSRDQKFTFDLLLDSIKLFEKIVRK